MTQFMLISRGIDKIKWKGVSVQRIDDKDELFTAVAKYYFGDAKDSCLVTDEAGRTESLVDDVCDIQRAGGPMYETLFVRLLTMLIDNGIAFVCWNGADFYEIPISHSWRDVEVQLRAQTAMQPADLYLFYTPDER